MNPRSLRFRLIAWYAGLLVGVFVLLSSAMYFGLQHYLERNLNESLQRRARQMGATLLARIDQTGERYVIDEIKALYAPELNSRFIRITAANGRVLYVSGQPKDQSFDPAQVLPLSDLARPESVREVQAPDDRNLLVTALPFLTRTDQRYVLEIGAPLAPIASMLDRLRFLLLAGLPVVVAVAIGGGYYLVGRALAPVEEIAHKAEQITQHNLTERLPVAQTGDELERLSISLNHMITRLEEAIRTTKRFVADASHELRTPLTTLRGELESVVQGFPAAPELRETLGSMLEEVERLAKIVERLFALSRLDAGEAQAECVRFDLGELAATTADQMSLLAEDKRISVACQAARGVGVQGDRARLKQVVVNLLDNAIKYTPEGGAIRLQVTASNGHAVLEVADNGIGIPPEALPHVFEPFFRVDKARSRDLGGAGLGLSIVKSICSAHGGEIDVESTVSRGSRFRVKLPLAEAPSAEQP